jgi:signal peptidase I
MRRPLRAASLLAVLAAAAAAWFFLAPLELGGSTSYAVVFGSSMEPHLHRGDLVVLRRGTAYRRGDVVGYHSLDLHRNVLHRIVGAHGGRVVFKGDNNDFLDPERPKRDQLFGREWIVVPGAGAVLERLRTPRYAALAAALAVLLLVGAGPGGGARRRRRRRAQPRTETRAPAPSPTAPRPHRQARGPATRAVGTIACVGIAALAAGASLGVVSLRQPAVRVVAEPDLYVQHGAFSWSAPTPRGAVYQAATLRPRDPVFLRLVHRLDVRFVYRVRSSYPSSFAGSATLAAVLSDGNGWRHRFVLDEGRRLRDGRVELDGTLDLRRLTATVRQFEAQTSAHNPSYHVVLVPRVGLLGVAGGHPVRRTFAPPLALDLDDVRLQIASTPSGSNSLVRSAAAGGSHTEPVTLHLLGRQLGIRAARRLALGTVAAGLAALLTAAALTLLRRRDDEVAAIQRRYAELLVTVAPRGRDRAGERRVESIGALARIAERYDRLILHEEDAGRHSFLVEDAGVVFRYDVVRPHEDTDEDTAELPALPVRLHTVER